MSKERVGCFTAGCDICSNAVLVGKTFYWEEPLYSCRAYRKKHKKIDAKDCGEFRCNRESYMALCDDCRRGK